MNPNVTSHGVLIDRTAYVPPTQGAPQQAGRIGPGPLLLDKETGRLLTQNQDDRTVNSVGTLPVAGLWIAGQATYAANSIIGGKLGCQQALGRASVALLEGVSVIDLDGNGKAFDVMVFSQPLVSSITDGGALPGTWNITDATSFTAVISIRATDYVNVGGGVQFATRAVPVPINSTATDGTLGVVLVARDAFTFTQDITKNLRVKLLIRKLS